VFSLTLYVLRSAFDRHRIEIGAGVSVRFVHLLSAVKAKGLDCVIVGLLLNLGFGDQLQQLGS
jgi:hypothetical protein